MQSKQKVFIITGIHNDFDNVKKLMPCIKDQTYREIETIIVDDGSTDGAFSYIQKYYPSVSLLRGDGTLWWTGVLFMGVIEVLKRANKDDFILTINNDCIFDKNYISILVKTSQTHKRAITGSVVLSMEDKTSLWDGGVKIDWNKGKFISLGLSDNDNSFKKQEVRDDIDVISTKGTLYPIEIFSKSGNFDKTHLPHYISDYEFACRAKKKGAKLLISLKSIVYNDTSNTGFGENLKRPISLSYLYQLLFSRRSKINIVDHFWFITLCCPNKYKLQNYLRLILKILYLFSLVL